MTAFRDLPTIARRSFEAFLRRFQDENPGSNMSVTADPSPAEGGFTVPFADATSGARYEVTIGDDGTVGEPRQLA